MINNMMTVHEAAEIFGISIRTLQYYDKISLLSPSAVTDAGYRLYDDTTLDKLRQIMLFRELEFPLKEIISIMNDPHYDAKKALEQQLELLRLRREHIDDLIRFAEKIQRTGVDHLMTKNDFSVFDKSKIDDYARRAKEQWGGTAEYKEFEGKNTARSDKDNSDLIRRTMTFFEKFGELKDLDPADKEVQDLVRELQKFFCENYYNCTDEILLGLGKMYAGGGEFTENIDKAGGTGTAEFVHRAIEIYCK